MTGQFSEQRQPAEIGIIKNYGAEYSIDQVLRSHRAFALQSMSSITRFEIDDLNIDNGFVAVRAFGPPHEEELAMLDEIFGMMHAPKGSK